MLAAGLAVRVGGKVATTTGAAATGAGIISAVLVGVSGSEV